MTPVCSNFSLPSHIIYREYLYVLGYSYFLLEANEISPHELRTAYTTREEAEALNELRWWLPRLEDEKSLLILADHPSLPRLLHPKDECHNFLFGLLLYHGRVKELETLYGVALWSDTGTVATRIEKFGTTCVRHEGIVMNRDLESSTSSRGIRVEGGMGSGSFGIVFFSNIGLVKYNTMSVEYCREFLMHMMLNMTSKDLPPEVMPVTRINEDMIPNHIIGLQHLTPLSRSEISKCRHHSLPATASWLEGLRYLFGAIIALRDRFIMHLDISTTNVMWDSQTSNFRLIDCAGTIGDDTFFNLGLTVDRVCTRSTRPPEYCSRELLWQRNETSEILSAYYAVTSYISDPNVVNKLPHVKEEIYSPIHSESSIHQARHTKMKERPSPNQLLSHIPPDMGTVGSLNRFSHLRRCLSLFVSNWPLGRNTWDFASLSRRKIFVEQLLSCVDDPGDLGGIAHHAVCPPYLTTRCIALYDAFHELGESPPVNALLYVALASSRSDLIDIEHYPSHPVHLILQVLLKNSHLMSLFLSPITVFALLLLETPRATLNDAVILRGNQPFIRCLYNLRRDKRHPPMRDPWLGKIGKFVREYMSKLLVEPLILENESQWWNEVFKGELHRVGQPSPQATRHVDNVIRRWFT